MTYNTAAKVSRQTKTRDDFNGGTVRLVSAAAAVLAQATLDTPCGAVTGEGLLTFGGFPKVPTALLSGDVAAVHFVSADTLIQKTVTSVGIPGSGAQVIIDNGSSTLTITAGAPVTIAAGPTLAHA